MADMNASDNVRGLVLALVAAGMFAMTAAMAKIAVTDYHVLQILFFRQVVVFCSSLPSIFNHFPRSLKTTHVTIHSIRLIGAFVALSCGIWAVEMLPLTSAITLGFAQVFFVAILASLFLNEHVGRHRKLAVLVGFIGVLIAMQPGVDGLIDLNACIPLAGALGAAAATISVRRLSQTESTATLLVYQATFVGLLAGVPLFWLWVTPDPGGLILLLGIGAIASVGQWLGIKALRLGEASVVGNVEYTKIVYAAAIGMVVFGETPELHTIAGATIIVTAAVYLYFRERQ